jgi:hypothetical protein
MISLLKWNETCACNMCKRARCAAKQGEPTEDRPDKHIVSIGQEGTVDNEDGMEAKNARQDKCKHGDEIAAEQPEIHESR